VPELTTSIASQTLPAERPDSVRADVELVRRCLAGDVRAQADFVARYAGLVFSVCRRRGLPADAAEDVAQDVLAEAFRALPRFRGEARLSTWLFTLASRHVAHYLRAPARRQLALGHPGDADFPEPSAPREHGLEARILERDRQARAREAVERLEEPVISRGRSACRKARSRAISIAAGWRFVRDWRSRERLRSIHCEAIRR
jgi:RNA polymerase sigma factor (sigma-70 family)